eukprot:2598786-Rhodomonas_salina.1
MGVIKRCYRLTVPHSGVFTTMPELTRWVRECSAQMCDGGKEEGERGTGTCVTARLQTFPKTLTPAFLACWDQLLREGGQADAQEAE